MSYSTRSLLQIIENPSCLVSLNELAENAKIARLAANADLEGLIALLSTRVRNTSHHAKQRLASQTADETESATTS
jgi:hypothetical protein